MHKIYDEWPNIASQSFETSYEQIDFKNIDHVVFAGMGGSGAIGDFFSSILSRTDIHVTLVKGYNLPKTVDSKTLVICTSISGNTNETLSILKDSTKTNCKKIAFSSGGKMETFCSKNNIKYQKIKQYHSPRASFVGFVYSMCKTLSTTIPIKETEIKNSIIELKKTKKIISSINITKKNTSLELALWIKGIPIIYYPWGLFAAATRFKNSLQENSKTHTIIEDVLEASHNGIVSWEQSSIVQPILLKGTDDNIKTKERWKIFENYFKNNKIEYQKITSKKGDIITKLMNLIYLLDYTSIYLAVNRKTDPTPVKSIDFIKKRIK